MSNPTDLSLLYGNAALVRSNVTRTAPDGTVTPYDLTGAAVVFTAQVGDDATVVYTVGSGITIIGAPAAGVIELRLDGDDFAEPGVYPYTLDVTAAGSDDPDTVLWGALAVTRTADPDVAAIRRLVGPSVPPSDAELLAAYGRLGDHRLVASEVLEARYVALASSPRSWKIDGHYSEDRGDLAELRSAIDGLKAEVAVEANGGGTMTISRLERADRSR